MEPEFNRTKPGSLRKLWKNARSVGGPEALADVGVDKAFLKKKQAVFDNWLALAQYLEETVIYENLTTDICRAILENDLVKADKLLTALEDSCSKGILNPYRKKFQ